MKYLIPIVIGLSLGCGKAPNKEGIEIGSDGTQYTYSKKTEYYLATKVTQVRSTVTTPTTASIQCQNSDPIFIGGYGLGYGVTARCYCSGADGFYSATLSAQEKVATTDNSFSCTCPVSTTQIEQVLYCLQKDYS